MSQRFFWRLYLSYATIVLATTVIIGALAHHQLKRVLTEEIDGVLRDKASIVAALAEEALASSHLGTLQQRAAELGKSTQTRITLIQPDGKVVADSMGNPARMDNHLTREEVQEALTGEVGDSMRLSATVDRVLFYVARPVARDGKLLGVVRVAIPLATVEGRLAQMRSTLVVGGVVGIIVALLVGGWVARRTTVPIREMIEVAEAMRSGDYDRRVRTIPNNEIGLLGDTFNRLGQELTDRVTSLSREKAQLQAMLSAMAEGVIAVDDSDTILFCNETARTMLDDNHIERAGRRLWESTRLLPIRELVDRARAGHRAPSREITLLGGKRALILNVIATSFSGGGGAHGVIVVLHDMSELRRLEGIRRDFVANVSHELKTPLTSIKGYVETLLGGALHDERNNVRFLEKIGLHVEQLTNLVQDLLHLARIESTDASLIRLDKVDWRDVVREVIPHHELSLRQKGLLLETAMGEEPIVVMGDRKAMIQIAENLVDNAIKYTPANGKVRVSARVENGWGCLEVADTGIGIPEQDIARVFERFYRVDKARSRDVGGTGLGLSIVKHLAQSMQGEVTVESKLDRGTCFKVLLPRPA